MIRAIDRIRAQAYALARSGRYGDCDGVERGLLADGFEDARQALLDPYVRQHVTQLCQRQRAAGKRSAALHIASTYLQG